MENASNLLIQTSEDLKVSFAGRIEACEANVAKHTEHLRDLDQRLGDALQRLGILEGNAEQIRQDADNLTNRVARAEVQPPRAVPNPTFDRDPDPTKLKVNGLESFAKEALGAVVSSLLKEDGKDPAIASIVGSNVGKKFSVQFSGAGQIASENAARFLQFLKNGDGTWKEISIQVPGSGSRSQRLYFGPDISPRQERIEQLTKKLADVIKSKVEDPKTVFARKREGIVTLDFVPLASILVPSPNECSLRWNTELVQSTGFDKDALALLFKAKSRPAAADVKWCS